MIEKLPEIQIHSCAKLNEKLNEVIDAVNEIMTWRFETDDDSDWHDDPKHREQPADPYAEQRKWIGKLCRFWNFDGGKIDLGILKSIDERKHTIPYLNDLDCSYAYCEPVKPDDDIIYKGGKDEL